MQFLLSYTIFIDALALIALIFLAAIAVSQKQSGGLAIIALIAAFWAIIRLIGFI